MRNAVMAILCKLRMTSPHMLSRGAYGRLHWMPFLALMVGLCGGGFGGVVWADVKLPNGEYIESHNDLTVKVLGGYITLTRTWSNGRWYLNPAWAALRFIRDPLDGSFKAIDRAGAVYLRQGALYVFDGLIGSRQFLQATATGWQWRDGAGYWIDYDALGRATGYGDRQGISVRFLLDAEGRRTEVRDHQDQVAFSFTYQEGRLSQARDRSGRTVSYRYDGDRLIEVTDAAGQVWKYSYDSQGQLTRRTNPLGGELTVFYAQPSPAGAFALDGDRARPSETSPVAQTGEPGRDIKVARVGQLTDEAGRITTYQYAYDALARQYTVTTLPPGGPTTVSRYDRDGRVLERTMGGQRQRLLTRDSDRLESVTDARGLVTRTEYDLDRRPLQITYPDGATVRYSYDAHYGQITQLIDEVGVETRYQYDAQGHVIERLEAAGRPEARRTTWTYDALGQRLTETVGDGATATTTTWSYDTWGNVATQTDPLGYTQRYTANAQGQVISWQDLVGSTWRADYDALGRLTRKVDPLNHETIFHYDALGQRLKTTDPTGAVTQYQYDPTGRLLTQTDALNQVTRYEYDTSGRLVATTDPAGQRTQHAYDSQGRLATVTDPTGAVTRYQYGSASDGLEGLLAAVIYPTYRVEYRYDARDRLTQTRQVLDAATVRVTQHVYDGKGQVRSQTNPAGQTTLSDYDGLGRLVRTTDALGGVTQYYYDAQDHLLTLTDAKGQTHRMEYDAAGHRLKESRPLGGSSQYRYDALGQVIERTDAAGNRRQFTYDAAGRKTEEIINTGTTPSQTIRYQYDAANRLTGYQQRGDTVSSASYVLDALGRPTQETLTYGSDANAITTTLQHAYTPDGRRQRLTYPGGSASTYDYQQGQLRTATLPGTADIRWATYQWQQPTRIDYPSVTRRLEYDPLQRLTHLHAQALGTGTADAPTGAVLLDWRFTYDAVGNVSQRQATDGLTQYGYDALNRLTEAVPPADLQQSSTHPDGLPVERYTYDAVHNRQSSAHQPGAWVYNADNQLTQYGEGTTLTSLGYTATGHRETEQQPHQQIQYSYDGAERLRQITRDNQLQATYQYDPFGRRIQKTVAGQSTWFVYAPEGLLAELNATGQMTRAYAWQPDTPFGTTPLGQAELTGTQWQWSFFQLDHLGTPQLATTAQGQLVWQAQAEAFGKTQVQNAQAITVNLRFPGQYYDEESGLHYNHMRDYDPATGRYAQSDPIGLEGGINTYAYVEENPLIYSDATGLDYWLENAAASEQGCNRGCGFHQSFCVGNPYGSRSCISFGRKPGQGNCWFDCKGHVYWDQSELGPIASGSYRYTDKTIDNKIIKYISSMIGQDDRYDILFGKNCRAFSQDLFADIDGKYHGKSGTPPSPPSVKPSKK
jgi:RHS repeat-associated protein